MFPQVRPCFVIDGVRQDWLQSRAREKGRKDMEMDELEPVQEPYWVRAGRIARELREIADVIEANPELAKLDDPYDAAERLLMDLDALDNLDAL